jgi:hypothetical protein
LDNNTLIMKNKNFEEKDKFEKKKLNSGNIMITDED